MRKDIDNPEKPATIYDLADEPNSPEALAKWQALGREITTRAK